VHAGSTDGAPLASLDATQPETAMPATHGRCAYSGIVSRPDHSCPDGARLAVHLGLNREHFAFGEGLGANLAPGVPQPCVLTYAWRDWGNRVAAWRMPEMPDELRLPTSMLVNGAMYDDAPSLMAAIRARGDEIVGHGRTNSERQSVLDQQPAGFGAAAYIWC
jgi:hypothetical protein